MEARMPFLTELDSRARIKGSRDPLGVQAIWVHFGRKVVGNLTTVTGSVRGFTTTLLGYHFVHEVLGKDGSGGPSALDVFLKFEQLAAYSRFHTYKDEEFRGIERVKERLSRSTRVVLSSEQRHQILSNQKIYGLWGLFSVPSRASSLLESDDHALTPVARSFVASEYLSKLDRAGLREGKAILDLLQANRAELDLGGRHAPISKAVASLLQPNLTNTEKEFYRRYLAYGGDHETTEGRQRQLAELMVGLKAGTVPGNVMIRRLISEASRRGPDWQGLAAKLGEIATLETLIAPAANVFDFLLARQGVSVQKAVTEIRTKWGSGLQHLSLEGLEALESEIGRALEDSGAASRWLLTAEALAAGQYESVLRLLIEQNAAVMSRRGGAPWLRLSKDKLEVRYQEETELLADGADLPALWRNPYFIDSLYTIVRSLWSAN
jgi:hypothetical protein